MDELEKKPRKKKKRKKKRYLLKISILIAIAIGVYIFLTSSIFDMSEVTVAGNDHYTGGQIMEIAGVSIGDNLFNTSSRDVKKKLMADPYIKNADLKRVLPDGYRIEVKERSESAAIKNDGKYLVVDGEGVILKEVEKAPTLTIVKGMKVELAEIGQAIEVEESADLVEVLKLLKKIEKRDLYFKKIEILPVTIRAYIYDELVCEGTPDNIYNNLDKLDKVIEDLYEKGIKRGVINIGGDDYISWKPEIKEK